MIPFDRYYRRIGNSGAFFAIFGHIKMACMKQLYLRHLLKFISFFVLMSLVVTPALQAQQQKLPVIDTLHIKAGTELKIDDSTHYYPNDTIMILSDTVVKNNPQLKTYLLYQKLENSAKKSVVTQKLFDIAFAGKDYLQRTDTIQQEKSGQRFDPYEGKIIRKVNYDVLDVIGPNVNDTVHYSLSDFQRWVNDLYPNTKDFVIKNNQLFKVGDSLDPLQLSNTERLLRELQSIKDARVEVRPLPGNPG